ncbi:hypothetical protein BU17DRAFT_61415 [Hysterangium stoloniferum]|nr:hypothetical protein BU17DRAFT_61415 [Hysterangium stoloniferum]
MQELTMAAWWNAGRTEYLRLTSWESFEKQIRNCFMPKGYKMVTLGTFFFLCTQNQQPFLDYTASLADARTALGPTIITSNIYKYQLLFHSHPMLLLHIMAIPEFNLEDITFDNLVALMSMQWESLIMEIPAATRSTLRPNPAHASSTTTSITPPHRSPLSITEREHLLTAGGYWRCQKVPTNVGWTTHWQGAYWMALDTQCFALCVNQTVGSGGSLTIVVAVMTLQ